MNTRQLVSASFERCDATNSFSETFYELFLAKSDAISGHFANTDLAHQKKLLRATIYILILQDIKKPKAQNILKKISATHAEDKLNIPPYLYEVWLDTLCETVKLRDPEHTTELEAQWRELMRAPIDYIVSRYQ